MESYVFGGVFILIGLLTASGKPIGFGKYREKYTTQSMNRFLPWAGVSEIVLGIGSIFQEIKNTVFFHFTGWLISILGILLFIISWKIILIPLYKK